MDRSAGFGVFQKVVHELREAKASGVAQLCAAVDCCERKPRVVGGAWKKVYRVF